MDGVLSLLTRRMALALALGALVSSAGCIGFTNWLLYGINGETLPAEFDDLEGCRVAVICASRSSTFDPSDDTGRIAARVGELMAANIDDIDVVDQEEIANWIDHNGWLEIDYLEIGRGVNADMVVAVEFTQLSFQDSSTLVKGRADFVVSVYDLRKGGARVFKRETPEHEYPSASPADMSVRRFRSLYIERLAHYIGRYFYKHDFDQTFANDAFAQ